jgi:hypothetical protein
MRITNVFVTSFAPCHCSDEHCLWQHGRVVLTFSPVVEGAGPCPPARLEMTPAQAEALAHIMVEGAGQAHAACTPRVLV